MITSRKSRRVYRAGRKPVSNSFSGKISSNLDYINIFKKGFLGDVSFALQILSLGILTFVFFGFFYLVVEPDNKVRAGEFNRVEILSHFYNNYNDSFLDEKVIITDNKPEEAEVNLLTYIVKSGDSLSVISQKLDIDIEDIKSLNSLSYPYSLSIGQGLKYPSR